jgi:hypothetical protein
MAPLRDPVRARNFAGAGRPYPENSGEKTGE